ncbi:nucleotidyltransferase domain-containing protein [Romboutsia sp.]|uniref:nucleotidyltransferase domain-containing protein n=1 Tax=Romboutsia sp. TaxID=1965302 RepID=UPI003F406206
MRSVSKQIKDTIINCLPKEITEAIYVFGSYGTDNYKDGISDIDIAWFTKIKLDLTEIMMYKDLLEKALNIEVDLKNPTDSYPIYLLSEIYSGIIINEPSIEFKNKFFSFYLDNKDFIDLTRRCMWR